MSKKFQFIKGCECPQPERTLPGNYEEVMALLIEIRSICSSLASTETNMSLASAYEFSAISITESIDYILESVDVSSGSDADDVS